MAVLSAPGPAFFEPAHYYLAAVDYLRFSDLLAPVMSAQARRAAAGQRLASIDDWVRPRRLAALSRELLNLDANIRWSAYARPEKGFTSKLLELAANAGCRLMLWGLESASQHVLNRMGKGTRIDEVSAVLCQAQAAGIANLVFVMFGFPGETLDESETTLAFLDAHAGALAAVSRTASSCSPTRPCWPSRHASA
jgi:hypothetical protein